MKSQFHNTEVAATMHSVAQLLKRAVVQEDDGIRTCSVRMPIYGCANSPMLRPHLIKSEVELLHELVPLVLDRLPTRLVHRPSVEQLDEFEGRTQHMLQLIAEGRMHNFEHAAPYSDYVAHVRAGKGQLFQPEHMAFMELMAAESPQHGITTIASVFKLYLRLREEDRTTYELLHQIYIRCATT